jgi:MYXO-CTERM domain-containing protein
MASPALASTTACALALAALALLPAEARACEPDPCYGVYEWLDFVFPVNTDSIPRDGVIILSYNAVGDLSPAEVAAGLELTLTQDGMPVAGVVEDVGVPGTVVFRPAAPLVPNVLTTATLLYNNPSDAKDAGCAFGDVEFEFDMHIAAADSVPLEPPELTGSYTVDVLEDRGLDDLACCDGAYPTTFECGGVDVYWEDGYCTPIRGTRVLSLSLLASNLLPKPTAGQLATTYRINGADAFTGPGTTNLFTFAESEACVVVEQRNLANGDTIQSPETCFGADEQLGPVDIDPGPDLAGFCAGAPYTCEVAGDADPAQWDPEQCTPLDPPGETGDAPTSTASDGDSSGADESGDGDPPEDGKADGCGCTTTPTAPAPLLGLAALALLRRRRRA